MGPNSCRALGTLSSKAPVGFRTKAVTKEDKRLLVDMLGRSIPYREGSYRVASVISLYVKDCLDALARKLSVDEIEPFDVI